MRAATAVLLLVGYLCAVTASAWDINDPNAPLDGSVSGASTGGVVDDVVIINDVDPTTGDVEGASTSGSGPKVGSGASEAGGSSAGNTEIVVVDGSSAVGHMEASSSASGSGSQAVLAAGAPEAAGNKDSAGTLDGNVTTPKAQETRTSMPVTVGVVIAGVAAAMGIVVGGIALLRRAARPTGPAAGAGTACTAAALQGGAAHAQYLRADSVVSEAHKLRIIQVDVDDDTVEV